MPMASQGARGSVALNKPGRRTMDPAFFQKRTAQLASGSNHDVFSLWKVARVYTRMRLRRRVGASRA